MKQYIKNENINIRTGIVVFKDIFINTTAIVQIVKICHRCTDKKILKRFSQKNKLRLFTSVEINRSINLCICGIYKQRSCLILNLLLSNLLLFPNKQTHNKLGITSKSIIIKHSSNMVGVFLSK